MEFQIVNEISTFWGTLVPPIFLGLLSLILFGWVIGKDNCDRILERLSKRSNSSPQYVLHKGIYIPKEQTTRSVFIQSISKRFGFESLKPLMAIFFVVLIFFGLNQLLTQIFQPLITYSGSRVLYSCGVDDNLIAMIWMHFPHIDNSDQLYAIIVDLTKETQRSANLFLFSVESFARFNIICCAAILVRMIFRIKKPKWVNKKVFLRLVAAFFILVFVMAGTLFSNIHQINKETESRCHEAYSILKKNEQAAVQDENLDTYLEMIKQDRKRYGEDLFYGAFGLNFRFTDSIANAAKELYRFFSD